MSASHSPDPDTLIPELLDLYKKMEVRPEYDHLALQTAQRLYFDIGRYIAFVNQYCPSVPAVLIACLAERESGGSWGACLHNGDPWNKKTVNVPVGRGGWSSWEEAAADAVRYDGLDKVSNWNVGTLIFREIAYNGWGYWYHGILASPYAFAGSSLQVPGKYVRDGVFDPTVMDPQLGGLLVYKKLCELDPGLALPE